MGKVTIERNNKSVIFEIKDEEIEVYPFLKNSVQALKYLDYHESLITDDFGMITTELYEERGVQICDRNEVEKNMFSKDEVLKFTQTVISQYKVGNTNIENIDLLTETLKKFKEK
jgi:hypothetical protein